MRKGDEVLLAIRYYGDPVLRESFRRVEVFDDDLRRFAEDLIETMRDSHGVGLAAQQVGDTRAVCVIEVPEAYDTDEEGHRLNPELPMPLVLVNPVVSEPTRRTEGFEEGCLSFPDIRGTIVRPVEVTLAYQDLNGTAHTVVVRDFTARVIQHEVDHLNGILFIDRMSPAKKLALRNRLKRLKAEAGVRSP